MHATVNFMPCLDSKIHPDVHTDGNVQWFFFKIHNIIPGVRYQFNLGNFKKRSSQFCHGQKPVCWSTDSTKKPNVRNTNINKLSTVDEEKLSDEEHCEWHHFGDNIKYGPANKVLDCYYHQQHSSQPNTKSKNIELHKALKQLDMNFFEECNEIYERYRRIAVRSRVQTNKIYDERNSDQKSKISGEVKGISCKATRTHIRTNNKADSLSYSAIAKQAAKKKKSKSGVKNDNFLKIVEKRTQRHKYVRRRARKRQCNILHFEAEVCYVDMRSCKLLIILTYLICCYIGS